VIAAARVWIDFRVAWREKERLEYRDLRPSEKTNAADDGSAAAFKDHEANAQK
jgi:hypothetical protein